MKARVSALLYSAFAVLATQCTETVSAASGGSPPSPPDKQAARKDAAARANDLKFMDLLKYTIDSQIDIFPQKVASLRFIVRTLNDLRCLFYRAYYRIRFRATTTSREIAVGLATNMNDHLQRLRRPLIDDALFGLQYFHMLEARVQYVIYRLNNLHAR